jgi:hypothetical protein
VHEVPAPQLPLLALDDEQPLAVDDEEVLLVGLPVVEPDRLAPLQHVEADADLRELRFALEDAAQSASAALAPACFARVDDERDVALNSWRFRGLPAAW